MEELEYTEVSVPFELGTVYECPLCGALVQDTTRHTEWHNNLRHLVTDWLNDNQSGTTIFLSK